uniref:Uncharacterized protein n=1 Tax=Noccaea caerulescens TaxID=107243 RepID=A0A1J3I1I1_NOCCA
MMEMEEANNLHGQPRPLFLNAETDEAGLSGDESDNSGETGFSNFTCIHDLNEPAKIEKHSDIELNQFLSPAQTRCVRAENENGIDLNMSPFPSEQVTTSLKTIEPEQPRESISASLQGKHEPQTRNPKESKTETRHCGNSFSQQSPKRLKEW